MPAYNGIRGYWNEVRVNSNYKSKNAVPQGTELEAGMQTKRKKSRYVFWKTEVLFTTLFFAALLFAGCSVEQTNRTKISDLDYTIAAEADIPGAAGEIPYYAILNEENQALYEKYRALTAGFPKFHLLGRLAEYKYYNIDAMTKKAMELADATLSTHTPSALVDLT